MSYLDNLYVPPEELLNENDSYIQINSVSKHKNWKDVLKHYAKKAAIGAGIAGLAGYGLYRAGQDGKNAINNKYNQIKASINNRFHESGDSCMRSKFKGEKSLVDGYNTFAALGYNRPENLNKLSDKLFRKRDDNESVIDGGYGNPSIYNNG